MVLDALQGVSEQAGVSLTVFCFFDAVREGEDPDDPRLSPLVGTL